VFVSLRCLNQIYHSNRCLFPPFPPHRSRARCSGTATTAALARCRRSSTSWPPRRPPPSSCPARRSGPPAPLAPPPPPPSWRTTPSLPLLPPAAAAAPPTLRLRVRSLCPRSRCRRSCRLSRPPCPLPRLPLCPPRRPRCLRSRAAWLLPLLRWPSALLLLLRWRRWRCRLRCPRRPAQPPSSKPTSAPDWTLRSQVCAFLVLIVRIISSRSVMPSLSSTHSAHARGPVRRSFWYRRGGC